MWEFYGCDRGNNLSSKCACFGERGSKSDKRFLLDLVLGSTVQSQPSVSVLALSSSFLDDDVKVLSVEKRRIYVLGQTRYFSMPDLQHCGCAIANSRWQALRKASSCTLAARMVNAIQWHTGHETHIVLSRGILKLLGSILTRIRVCKMKTGCQYGRVLVDLGL
jgi:hypothetical protein